MSTVQFCAPTHKKTITLAAHTTDRSNPLDPLGLLYGIPTITTRKAASRWGYQHGLNGLNLWTGDLAPDLVDHARQAYQVGQSRRDALARFQAAQEDDGSTEYAPCEVHRDGMLTWEPLLTPEELADGLRDLIATMDGDGQVIQFARQSLRGNAVDVVAFRARCYAELDGRVTEMCKSYGAIEAGV